MYCSACGKEVPGDVRFCGGCGAPVSPPGSAADSPPAPAVAPPALAPPPLPAVGQPVAPPVGEPIPAPPVAPPVGFQTYAPPAHPAGWYPGGLGTPGGKGRRGLWIALAAVAVVVIAAAITVPLVLARDGNDAVTATSTTPTTSTTTKPVSTTEPATSSTSATSGTSSTSTSVTAATGLPGDSTGEWVETDIPGAPAQVVAVAVSNNVLLMQTQADPGYRLYAYYFLLDKMIELPVEASDLGGIDVDDTVAVWWEGTYDEASSSYIDQHIYSYMVPDGPKVEVAGGGNNVGYPQIAGIWITWIEGSPWEPNPEEFWQVPIYGSFVSLGTGTANEITAFASWGVSPVASILGDSSWTYSLGETFLAWEQAAAVGALDTGTYVLDLSNMPAGPQSIGTEAWRPSIGGDTLVYWEDGLKALDLKSGEKRDIDPNGNFPTAAPTFAAYFRPTDSGDGTTYEIVARGLTGGYEQVLAQQSDAPWLSPAIAAAGNHVAFVANGALYVFEWKGR